jgi:DnaJ-class molecular chaperone
MSDAEQLPYPHSDPCLMCLGNGWVFNSQDGVTSKVACPRCEGKTKPWPEKGEE